MAEMGGKPFCPICGLRGRVRVLKDKTLVCGDCGYDSRDKVEMEVKKT